MSSFPTGWPPRSSSGLRSIRVYITGSATANWTDNAYLFSQVTSANTFLPTPYVPPGGERTVVSLGTPTTVSGTPMGAGQDPHDGSGDPALNGAAPPTPVPMIWARMIRIQNLSDATLYFSFDGVNVHGQVPANTAVTYHERFEAGIALKGSSTFVVEAW